MYFLNTDLLILQLLPPNWRTVKGKVSFLKVLLSPVKKTLKDLKTFRKAQQKDINLTAQVIVIEHYIERLLEVHYGVSVGETGPGRFSINLPKAARGRENEIKQFLGKVLPMGRRYELRIKN